MKNAQVERLRPVSGRHNALIKEVRRAFAQGQPTAEGDCAVEGMRIVEEAIRSGLRLRAVLFSGSGQARAGRLIPQLAAQVETLLLPDKLFTSVVPSETPQGVAALVRMKSFTFEDVLAGDKDPPLVVAVAGVQDPGNLGTILRSAEAFGASSVLLGENTVSAYNSKVVRASAGSIFRIPLVKQELKTALPVLREHGLRLLATSSHKGTPLPEVELTARLALLVGSEGAGLGHEIMTQVDEVVAIPHSPRVESLNAGVAASIVLYEAARQRSFHHRDTEKR
ncbi:MAG TPA: RNA methyltransferase [Terriglobales bacterium]|nr:RNA methyltransferase [Terriglobales bacterium]